MPREVLTEAQHVIRKFEEKGIQKLNINEDFIEYLLASFDLMMNEKCMHNIGERDVKESLIYVQNLSVVSFFLLVQLPLSRVSALFTFATGFLVWFIDT